jgi:ribonuclease P protein component
MSLGSARFGRDRRIRKSDEFGVILKVGSRGTTPLLTVALVPSHGAGRIGISAPVKVGNAVLRNRARRLVREHYRKTSMRAAPYDIVFNLKPGFAELSAAVAGSVLDEALSKAIAAGKRTGRRSPPVH